MAQASYKRISGTAYQALRTTIARVFWYKPTLEKYLRTALRDHPELLAGIDFKAKKWQIADQLVDRLIEKEHTYQQATVQLMVELANMTTFPELENHEDSEKWLPLGVEAVAELKRHTAPYEHLISEREKLVAERAAYTQQVELQRRFSDEVEGLRGKFFQLHGMTDAQQRGRDFEKFLNSLFSLFDLDPRLAYDNKTEQIDGAFSFDTDDYILEAKWTKDPVSREQADSFAKKVERKGKNALGLIISINGLSRDARTEYSRSTPFMTLDGQDLMYVLEQRGMLDDLLRRKKRHANETGECFFPVSRM
jgi:hypothetical protein